MSERSYHGATSRSGSTTRDRSDDPSHHERMLLPRSYISLLLTRNKVYCELGKYLFIFTSPNITACSVGFPTPVTTSPPQLQLPHPSYNFPTRYNFPTPVTTSPPQLQPPQPSYNFPTRVTTSLPPLQFPHSTLFYTLLSSYNFPSPVTTSHPCYNFPTPGTNSLPQM